MGRGRRLNWRHLIQTARLLAGDSPTQQMQGRPRQAMLKRAISTAYYAMFHALCNSNADLVAGQPVDPPSREAWTRTYRSLDHRPARNRLAEVQMSMHPAVRRFAIAFALLQEQRLTADYDPHSRFLRNEVFDLIDIAETATSDLMSTTPAVRRPLATLVLLRER